MKIEGQTIILDAGESVTIKAQAAGEVQVPSDEKEEPKADKLLYKVGLISDIHMDVNDQNQSEYMQDLVNASNLLATKNAAAFSRVAYVDATDVTTTISFMTRNTANTECTTSAGKPTMWATL